MATARRAKMRAPGARKTCSIISAGQLGVAIAGFNGRAGVVILGDEGGRWTETELAFLKERGGNSLKPSRRRSAALPRLDRT